ncbi:MAG: hypothetical protein ACE5E8_02510 [Acidimicrobiia bacterium]
MMTQQYLAGELSLLLEQLQAAAGDESARELTELRHRAEAGPPPALRWTARRALQIAERECWGALGRGDVATLDRRAALSASLWQFAVCSHLIEER